MIVCHCKAVSDREIKRSLMGGAGSVNDVGDATGAGTKCGRCRPVVHDLVDEVRGGCRGCGDCAASCAA